MLAQQNILRSIPLAYDRELEVLCHRYLFWDYHPQFTFTFHLQFCKYLDKYEKQIQWPIVFFLLLKADNIEF